MVACDINGVGIFIQGKGGIGKSEALLELIKRGHRMIADNAVEMRKVSNSYLIGSAPEKLWSYMEIRGIGIVNVKFMFEVQSLKRNHEIELVVTSEKWDPATNFDRLDLDMEYRVVHGISLSHYRIPVMPGRNIAVIIEAIALHYRQYQLGYHKIEELIEKLQFEQIRGPEKGKKYRVIREMFKKHFYLIDIFQKSYLRRNLIESHGN